MTFEPFRQWYKATGKPKMELRSDTGFSPSTMKKIWQDLFPVRSDVIERLCETYNLPVEQVIKYKGESK